MKISLIGAGNVATHLALALKKAGHQIVDVYSPSLVTAEELRKKIGIKAHNPSFQSANLPISSSADLYIIAVSDHAVKNVLRSFPFKDKPIVHTSGSVSMKAFGKRFTNAGVLYPLQTFSKERNTDFNKVPLLIEATNHKTLTVIKRVAVSISSTVIEMNSMDRKTVHLASVISNNFTNHLFLLADKILKRKNIPFSILTSLLKETVKKAIQFSPSAAQTGPARRGDAEIIEEHLKMLSKEPRLKQIYQLLTQSIEETSGAKL